MSAPQGVYRRAPAFAADARALAWGVALTAGLFCALPLAGSLSERRMREPLIQATEMVFPDMPPPPAEERPAEPDTPSPDPEPLPEPPESEPPQQQPDVPPMELHLPMKALDMSLGDFALAFTPDTVAVSPPPALPVPEVFSISDLDERPRAVSLVEPVYPLHARRRKVEGTVEVAFLIEPDGRTAAPRVLRAEPGDIFAAAALQAVGRWRFTPPKRDGKAVRVRVTQMIRFRLED